MFSAEMAAKVGPGPVAATQLQTEAYFANLLMAFERHFSSANFFTLLGKHFYCNVNDIFCKILNSRRNLL